MRILPTRHEPEPLAEIRARFALAAEIRTPRLCASARFHSVIHSLALAATNVLFPIKWFRGGQAGAQRGECRFGDV
jgi:hypothetical protein